VLRTFSKMFGLAGLRIGIMLSNEKIITALSKVKLPYNLNILTLSALETILDDGRYINENIKLINNEKHLLEKTLKGIKEIEVTASAANFFLVRVRDSKWLFERLLSFGVLVRDVSSYPMLKNCLRISIGDKKQNKALINALNKIYNNN
jgi:histidinol-phosphate aminotransferase